MPNPNLPQETLPPIEAKANLNPLEATPLKIAGIATALAGLAAPALGIALSIIGMKTIVGKPPEFLKNYIEGGKKNRTAS